jgi:hypothetical protein
MQFKKFSAGVTSYGVSGDNLEAMKQRGSVVPNVNFDDPKFYHDTANNPS